MAVVKIKITPTVLALFDLHRLSSAPRGMRWQVGETLLLDSEARIERYAQVNVGQVLPLALGAFSYSHSPAHSGMKIGRYCSLSWRVDVLEGDHPMDWATTSPVTHDPRDLRGVALYLHDIGVKPYGLHPTGTILKPATLGHDVWIGSDALVKRGVTVGHGAVVGAGSIVTRDVPPYAIVAGTPARVLRYRFPDAVIERLLASAWWRFGPDQIQAFDPRDPVAFLDRVEAAIADGLAPLDLPVLRGEQIIAASERT